MADISKIEGYNIKDAAARSSINSLETAVAAKANSADVEHELEDLTAAFNTAIAAKQDKLVSGTNIKTVNGNDITGSGNVNIQSLPSGGVKNNLLYKKSSTDGDVGWTSITTDNLLTQDNIVNNLTSTSTTNALGAGQGKILNDSINNLKPTTYTNISVSVTPAAMSSYCSWDTQQAYGYSATITVNGLTTNSLIQNIVMTDTLLSAIASVVTTTTNGLIFYTADETALSGTIYTLVTMEV